jgi:F-type H+-transporting ATPase subunit alpha
VARFARFGTEVDEATQRQIQRGERLRAVLRQPAHQPLSLASQVVILLAVIEGYLDDIAPGEVPAFKSGLWDHFGAAHPGILSQINRSGELTDETREALTEVIADYHAAWLEGDAPRGAEGPALSQAEGPALSQAEGRSEQ